MHDLKQNVISKQDRNVAKEKFSQNLERKVGRLTIA